MLDYSKNINISNNTVEATTKIASLIEDLRKLHELKQILLNKEANLKNIVVDYMGLATQLAYKNNTIATYQTTTRSAFNLTEFKLEYPELYNLFLENTNNTIFRLL